LLTAVAFQDIVFEELPNVAYLTLLHKYIIVSFIFIAGVCLQTAMTAIDTGSDEEGEGVFGDYRVFDTSSLGFFVFVFVTYNVWFAIDMGWKRHWESKKLYMDSEELAEYVEERKHQFKMPWSDWSFRGKDGRIAFFESVDPLLEMSSDEASYSTSFWKFMGYSMKRMLMHCLTCRPCRNCGESEAQSRKHINKQRTMHADLDASKLDSE